MKVKITENSKKILTLADMPAARKIISDLKEDTGLNDYAQMAAHVASSCNGEFEILKAEAEIAKNARAWNAYDNDSGNIDVWLEIYAYNAYDGFFNIGVYLTDLWAIDGKNNDEIRAHMFVCEYKREK